MKVNLIGLIFKDFYNVAFLSLYVINYNPFSILDKLNYFLSLCCINIQIGIFYHFDPENAGFNGFSLEITSTVVHLEFSEFLEFIVCLCILL